MKTLRERNRLAAMRETQRIALELFQHRGFDSVTVEHVAESAGMAASTIYRHFGTKEALVLWHEHDAEIDTALGRRLGTQPLLEAIRDGLIEALADRWDTDPFQLERITYIYATEQLHAAAVEGDFRDRAELTAGLIRLLPKKEKDAAPLLAGSALLALDVAIDRWQKDRGRTPLRRLIADAFDTLTRLDTIG